MFEKRTESIERATRAMKGEREEAPLPAKRVTDRELFALGGAHYTQVIVPKAN